MTHSNSSDSNLRELEERLDFLLSVEVDDELSSAERAELAEIRRDSPELVTRLAARRADFERGDTVLRRIAGTPLASTERPSAADSTASADSAARPSSDAAFEASLRQSFEAIQARIAGEPEGLESQAAGSGSRLSNAALSEDGLSEDAAFEDAPVDELAKRRRSARSWVPPVVLAAAAAWVLYLVVPNDGPSSSRYLGADAESTGLATTATRAEAPLRKSAEAAEERLAQASPEAASNASRKASPAAADSAGSRPPTATAARPAASPATSPEPSATPPLAPERIARQRGEDFARSKSAESLASADAVLSDLAAAIRPNSEAAASLARSPTSEGFASLRESNGIREDESLEPLELAIVFGPDESGDESGSDDALSAEDFEIIEQLELLEYLATQGARG